jgi:protein arginine kinase
MSTSDINRLLKQSSEWLRGTGQNADIVISSRVRLARNLSRFPFSHWASKKHEKEVMRMAEEAIQKSNSMHNALLVHINDIADVDKQFLLERHLISREHILRPEFKSVVVSDREVMSIMVNEEDHIRIQVMQSGFNLQECWRIADRMDTELAKDLSYAFHPEWGFLTACPTNTGTGLRSSVMLHLPALVMTKQVNRVIQAITKLGMTARGLYGEGTEAEGNFFQISNQVTLGQSEMDTVDNIERVIRQIIGHEETARRNLMKQNQEMVRDKVCRAMGILSNAHVISSKETIQLLSMVRLGADLGVLDGIERRAVSELFIFIQPGHLQKMDGKILTQTQRDVKRAQLIRNRLLGK